MAGTRTARRMSMAALLLVALSPTLLIGSAKAATQLLPDFRMATLTKVSVDTKTIPGSRLLRYTATIVNAGSGAFEARGTRTDTSTPTMSVSQRIYDDANGSVDVPVPGTSMFWAGDGHNHWHLSDLEGGALQRADNGNQVGALEKQGFHFSDGAAYDLGLPNAPQSAVYTACGGKSCNISALKVTMGLSVGWQDTYPAYVPLQWIDITGLAPGQYVLTVTADPNHVFTESDAANNSASALLRLTNKGVSIVSTSGGV